MHISDLFRHDGMQPVVQQLFLASRYSNPLRHLTDHQFISIKHKKMVSKQDQFVVTNF